MRKLYVSEPNDVQMQTYEDVAPVQEDEVKVHIRYAGICGSDISYLKGKFAHGKFPLIPGHEAVGTIVEAGEDALYQIGTKVVILPNTYCGTCLFCKEGKTNICENKQSFGINKDGAFQDMFVVSSKFVLPIPNDIPEERAVIIEPLAVVVSACKKVQIKEGMNIAVIGSGTIGLLSIAYALYLGANVTVTDINPKKHECAQQLGDVQTAYPHEIEEGAFDIVIEAAGTADSFVQAIRCMKPGGAMIGIGIVPDVEIPATQIIRNDQTIYGSIIYKFPEYFEDTIQLLQQKNFFIDPIYSKTFPLEQYKEAFALAKYGTEAKITLDFAQSSI